MTCWDLTAAPGDEVGLLLPIDRALLRSLRLRTTRDGILQPMLDQAPPHPFNGRQTGFERLADLLV